ncbi:MULTISPECIES: hypothetical protein [unclassified Acinetobacter]|uniref:hypothetical protein n=1 Tax=unclassified Acinetobacter TaxID=196816 RepID=UPI002934C853|nr:MULTISPECIES: hypothetical protein [unclassified Acinetobacter]WOE32156.1 hypothetical protein QSG84_02780 [Acinetobacter sp. SAAs470]WOE37626.1 hypothetical protein QSG86_11825 [Acinetobacter sp. SAAs474]
MKIDLTIEQMRQILDGAPERATHCFYYGKSFDYRIDYYKYFYNYLQMWLSDHGWFPVHEDMIEGTINLNDIRSALANDNLLTC